MNMAVLALSDIYAFSGVLCLGAIPCLIIALIPFSKGFIAGSFSSFILCIVCLFCVKGEYITNKSQTKWMRSPSENILNKGEFKIVNNDYYNRFRSTNLFIPKQEAENISDARHKSGKEYMDAEFEWIFGTDDWYIESVTYPSVNVSKEHGGRGIPQWIWHPAATIWIFGFFGAPMFAVSILSGIISGNRGK